MGGGQSKKKTEKSTDSGQTEHKHEDLYAKVAAQGDKVRKLKADKADKAQVQEAVKILLQMKEEYKTATGSDWQPSLGGQSKKKEKSPGSGQTEQKQASQSQQGPDCEDLHAKVAARGDKVRKLKADKAEKEQVQEAVKMLLQMKEEYRTST